MDKEVTVRLKKKTNALDLKMEEKRMQNKVPLTSEVIILKLQFLVFWCSRVAPKTARLAG